ncbi:bile acid:sodium symporter family protein [Streptomyces rapamycinicus]|uniref:Bile acid:sodium symporter n=2 Tax=Streptomyces rapamycinicus TaxID=1226757 RepID=A0A0A0NDH3_STRRN|nr:bile acid:sodium symporter family protein [Streptomyces rapamycinicus]AGP54143.1 membrane protein [Streptomyces rapamycinicus NRRL 5491]MBB4781644.1 sodium/bile acid cotransporter 7 [Streptomyces rapamycinicus]RLV73714.1 bile acid:sodium symporter [Streptomyces rapamycinicus NRRL 5491]UTO62226.1 bile acid:sodium symporter [Streptomyces rapamycinicus]UTP30180.1 bile acid:sodium symporter [Streptomyces rapamycinicus NRRL 5491]
MPHRPHVRKIALPALPSWLPLDGFILGLIGTVALAVLLPVSGRAATVTDGATTVAVAFLFFLYGARLSTREALDGVRHWRLHLTVLVCTFVIFPALGLAARGLVPYVLTHPLYTGLLFLCLVPSTVQSSIAFTSIARGNVAAAICAGSFSSLLGVVVTPVLVALLLGGSGSGGGFSADSMIKIGLQLLAPFLAGQLLRRWIGGFISRHRAVLRLVDRGSVLLVVYAAFSEGMVRGIWHQVTPARLAILLGVEAVLLTVMLTLTSYGSRKLGFVREDRITIVFAGSKKSLAAGLPMASVLFGAQASLAVLPLMLFHQMQLMVCAVLARRFAARAPEAAVTGAETRSVGRAEADSADDAALTRV